MRNRSPAKMAASEPPAPGLISTRHGRWANGWTGTREVTRLWEALESSARVSPRSSAASSRSSGSLVESWINDVSSVTDFSPDQPSHTTCKHECAYLIGLVPLLQRAHDGTVFAQLLC